MLGTIANFTSLSINTRFLTASALTLGVLLPGSLLGTAAVAVQLSNGQIAFDHAPRLLRAATSFNGARFPTSTYQFTLSVPSDAGEPLGAVTIAQRENLDTIAFDTSQSRAFRGNSFAGGPAVSLASVGGTQPSNPGEVTVVFDPPVSPGSTVTVALKPKSNPSQGGVYLFGVTAFPAGENTIGRFLGYGRIHFYDR